MSGRSGSPDFPFRRSALLISLHSPFANLCSSLSALRSRIHIDISSQTVWIANPSKTVAESDLLFAPLSFCTDALVGKTASSSSSDSGSFETAHKVFDELQQSISGKILIKHVSGKNVDHKGIKVELLG